MPNPLKPSTDVLTLFAEINEQSREIEKRANAFYDQHMRPVLEKITTLEEQNTFLEDFNRILQDSPRWPGTIGVKLVFDRDRLRQLKAQASV